MLEIWQLDETLWFPSPHRALKEPNGLLAFGGDLSPERLLTAYRMGIFPWFSEGEPPLWWSPAPRMVLYPEEVKISRSLSKRLKRGDFELTLDLAFSQVIHQCASLREHSTGTWITPEMESAYNVLHQRGYAHSVEAWQEGKLVGGLYGLALGGIFFGESMFSTATDASKAALVFLAQHLQRQGFHLIDCQVHSNHLASLGAREIPRETFLQALQLHTASQLQFLDALKAPVQQEDASDH
ncbi:leucyl/phenylalanyl-tRNA--protein transferase [Marinospirillum alkaliphilum]|uniref:Leucyl/phenylalanyl-tRNA--protein transferase n=1 Tax=Marinospirillum alkaliphilum DSM 21637 TaxID=1122209 RepID=A0A1K1TU29_9GAMM|nr:leucyl/phenylalanyl-tRNA--protein transferase [Marinospirillum alkaliphilum]SFX04032.1 leucyl/phenylalanyl-tRNA--protein transferase [Marinospirillum alkaliphilum DSM 21637]